MEISDITYLLFQIIPVCLFVFIGLLSKSVSWFLLFGTCGIISAWLAQMGYFRNFESLPPRLLLFLLPSYLACTVFALSSYSNQIRNLSNAWLIGLQSFRLPLELAIWLAVQASVAPSQMTWTGLNWDILFGISAIALAPIGNKRSKRFLIAWNIVGLGFLANVFIVAALSVPGPLQIIKPDNIWLADFPYIWLPAICVSIALTLHLSFVKKLLQS